MEEHIAVWPERDDIDPLPAAASERDGHGIDAQRDGLGERKLLDLLVCVSEDSQVARSGRGPDGSAAGEGKRDEPNSDCPHPQGRQRRSLRQTGTAKPHRAAPLGPRQGLT